jgi:ribosome-associated toxin RatA of RatAB toxin-antitoxin module
MRMSESVTVTAPASLVFPFIARLDAYPAWLPLVHEAVLVEGGTHAAAPAWAVELRARVGPFARSKRLRMQRTEIVEDRLAVFERAEVDGRHHARWALRAELDVLDDVTTVTMHLAYDGLLWTGGLLEKVLEEEVRRGRAGLAAAVDRR